MDLLVAVSLLAMVIALVAAGRRRPEGLLLAFFLGLVALNFFGFALGPTDPRWVRLAFVALALDPFYLLLFVTAYPYVRRPPGVGVLLALVGVSALFCSALVLGAPRLIVAAGPYSAPPRGFFHGLLILELAVAYLVAWLLSIRVAAEAATPILAKRAGWLVRAVGVAVVPRLGLLHADFQIATGGPESLAIPLVGLPYYAIGLLLEAAIMVALLAVGHYVARQGAPIHGVMLGKALRFVALVVALLFGARLVLEFVSQSTGNLNPWPAAYGLRWIVFGAILVYGILAFEIVEFRRASDRVVPMLGVSVVSVGAVLLTQALLRSGGADWGSALAIAAGVGLAASVPTWSLARFVARSFERTSTERVAVERRLELYRAALESAWARGPPGDSGRRRLEEDRKAFGVSYDEARALEHVVAASLRHPKPALDLGDEPFPGVVLERPLGRGAEGRVFSARRRPDGGLVVVKELHPEGLDDAQRRRAFLAQVRALGELDHPGIVRLLDHRVSGGRYLLLLEHVDGAPLSDVLEKGRLASGKVRGLLASLLEAVAVAHERGVLHRDIKPSNILLASDGPPRLIDFGLAKVGLDPLPVQETLTHVESAGPPAGTVAYMAPEQARGEPPGPAADLYALALVAYEALLGRPALDVVGLRAMEALERAARPRIDFSKVPRAWRAFFERALHPGPLQRFASAPDMLDALRRIPESAPNEAGTTAGRLGRRGGSSRPR